MLQGTQFLKLVSIVPLFVGLIKLLQMSFIAMLSVWVHDANHTISAQMGYNWVSEIGLLVHSRST